MSDLPLEISPSKKVRTAFWIAFLLFPIFSGLLFYDFLPNETYNERLHDLLASDEVCKDSGECARRAIEWKSKKSGELFRREDFSEHRHKEAFRVASLMFLYGMVGCFAFGYFNRQKSEHAFFTYLGGAVCVDAAIAAYNFLMLWN